jgi:chitin synthase
VTKPDLALTPKNFTETIPQAMHVSGTQQSDPNSKLHANDWYTARFLPKMKQFRKGPVVYKSKDLKGQAADQNLQKIWGVYEGDVYDLTDYFNTQTTFPNDNDYKFLDSGIEETFKERSGQDITGPLNQVFATMDPKVHAQNMNCMKNVFFVGQSDFRDTPRCQVQNYFLIVASAIIMASMVLKCTFLSYSFLLHSTCYRSLSNDISFM